MDTGVYGLSSCLWEQMLADAKFKSDVDKRQVFIDMLRGHVDKLPAERLNRLQRTLRCNRALLLQAKVSAAALLHDLNDVSPPARNAALAVHQSRPRPPFA